MTALTSTTPSRASALNSSHDESLRPLIDRLVARISASCNELTPFATVAEALDAATAAFISDRRVVLATPCRDEFAKRIERAASGVTVVEWTERNDRLEHLICAARECEVLVLSSPMTQCGRDVATLSPRDLLTLRSRAHKPLIVLDLLEEEYARTPLTLPALLLPRTTILRGFGQLWHDAGATTVANLAFIASACDLIAEVRATASASNEDALQAIAAAACADLDTPDIERRIAAGALEHRLRELQKSAA